MYTSVTAAVNSSMVKSYTLFYSVVEKLYGMSCTSKKEEKKCKILHRLVALIIIITPRYYILSRVAFTNDNIIM